MNADKPIILRHVKTGRLYEVIGPAKIQATLQDVVVYRSLTDNQRWISPAEEMMDGRFELAETPQ